MCLLSFVLLFKISYKCKYGDSIYIVGNTERLGNWNPNKALRLNWSEGHHWSLKVKLIHDNREPIQYKYIIAPTESVMIAEDIQWERGLNRLINFETTSKLCIQLNDEWEHRKVKIAVPYEAFKKDPSSSQEVFCYTNLPNKKGPISMELKKQTIPGQLNKDLFWTASFMIPYNITSFSYKLRAQEIETKEIQNDIVSRKFELKKFPYHASLKELYTVNCATHTKFDFKFSKTFNFDIVTEEICLGSCPSTANDVNELLSNGVKAVLNLQTDSDMEKLSVNWESLKQEYQKANIVLEHFPIIDMNNVDLAQKVHEAANLIEKLVKNNGKLYVHCSAGKYRSPHAVIFYLWYFKKYDLEEAIKLIKSKRVKARVNIYEEIFEQNILATR